LTDDELRHVGRLTSLDTLVLHGNFSSACVRHLYDLEKLSSFGYRDTWIQDEAIEDLAARLPLLPGLPF
jgi:hypothetical protein